jgi:hypothetical protein
MKIKDLFTESWADDDLEEIIDMFEYGLRLKDKTGFTYKGKTVVAVGFGKRAEAKWGKITLKDLETGKETVVGGSALYDEVWKQFR